METTHEPGKKTKIPWRKLFIDKFFDLIMVILGVYIAFQFNALKEKSDQRSLERFYLQSMVTDLKNDIGEIENNLSNLKNDHHLVSGFLQKMETSTAKADSLGPVLINVFSLDTFNPSQNTYSTLVHSNGMSIISRRETLSQMAEYYNQYSGIRRFEEVYTNVLLKAFEYFSPHCDFATQRITNPFILARSETRNFLLIIRSQLNDGIENYEDALGNARALEGEIENSLRN